MSGIILVGGVIILIVVLVFVVPVVIVIVAKVEVEAVIVVEIRPIRTNRPANHFPDASFHAPTSRAEPKPQTTLRDSR